VRDYNYLTFLEAAYYELLTSLEEPPWYRDTDQLNADLCLVTFANCHDATAAMLYAPDPIASRNLYAYWTRE
jgi:hypothetical protein